MSFFQRADLARLTGQTFGAKKRNLHALRRDGCCIESHKGPRCARRLLMDHARDEFLARAGRPKDHDAAIGRRHTIDGLAQLGYGKRCTDQLDSIAGALLQFLNLTLQL